MAMFTDIQGHWAESLLNSLAGEGKISGDGTGKFNPDAPMTRAQFAALIVRVFNPSAERAPVTFSDVPSTYWAANVIRQAYQAKFMSGFPNGTFQPEGQISRQDAIIVLASHYTGIVNPNYTLLSRYIDGAKISDYATAGVARASEKGWILNYPNLEALNPKLYATRAEVAGMIRIITKPTMRSNYAVCNLYGTCLV